MAPQSKGHIGSFSQLLDNGSGVRVLEAYFEEMALKITDLPMDALSQILSSVAKFPDGATEVAKSMTVCKRFLEACNNHIVFKAACFQRVEVANRFLLFQKTEGLLYKCASLGNSFARFLLAQVILKCASQLKRFGIQPSTLKKFREYSPRCNTGRTKFQEEYLSASLIANVSPGKGPRPFLYHWELVKLFLSHCNTIDIYNLLRHIHAYIEYFSGSRIGHKSDDAVVLLLSLYTMFDPETKYSCLTTLWGSYHILLMGGPSLQMLSENVLDEQMRVKVLELFDRVCCDFLSFVVPEKEE